MFRSLPPLIRWLILALGAELVGSLIYRALPLWLGVSGTLVLQGHEVWRFITFPLASSSPFAVLTAGLLLYFFGSELETTLHTRIVASRMAIAVVSFGLLFSVLEPVSMAGGPQFLSIFVLSAFSYMWPNREISLFGVFSLKAWWIAVAMVILAIIPFDSLHTNLSLSNLLPPIYAALSAIVLFHLKFRQYAFGRGALRTADNLRPNRNTREPPVSPQTRIDAILDKINAKGMDSLSKEEHEFLLRYSNNANR